MSRSVFLKYTLKYYHLILSCRPISTNEAYLLQYLLQMHCSKVNSVSNCFQLAQLNSITYLLRYTFIFFFSIAPDYTFVWCFSDFTKALVNLQMNLLYKPLIIISRSCLLNKENMKENHHLDENDTNMQLLLTLNW